MTKPDDQVTKDLRELVEQQNEYIKKLAQVPHGYSVVTNISEDKVFLTSISGEKCLTRKSHLAIKDLQIGEWVELTFDTQAPFARLVNMSVGKEAVITKVDNNKLHVKTTEGTIRHVFFNQEMKVDVGDTVLVDPNETVATTLIEKAKKKAANTIDKRVAWTDIGGHDKAKLEMIEAVELPFTRPELFQRYGKRPPKGILLYGPPGCGKTLLGKALASSLSKDEDNPGCFIYVKGPELLNPYVGVSESNVREVFESARTYAKQFNTPAVIFVDEADALLSARGKSHSTSRIEDTVVPMFLAEMDGLNESKAVVILATNRPDSLDQAVTRDGRIDRKIRIGRPNSIEAAAILSMYLSKVPCEQREELAVQIAEDLFTVERNLFEMKLANGEQRMFGLRDLVSGALLEGIVEKATQLAIRREIASNEQQQVLVSDLLAAIEEEYIQNIDVNHRFAMEDVAAPHDIKSIRKVVTNAA